MTFALAQAVLAGGVSDITYTGIDQSVNMLRQARKKCPGIELRIGTFLLLPLEDNCCDTVVSSYAFHRCSHEQIDDLIWIITADKQLQPQAGIASDKQS